MKEGLLRRYRDRIKQYRQNNTFQKNEKTYRQVEGKCKKTNQQYNKIIVVK